MWSQFTNSSVYRAFFMKFLKFCLGYGKKIQSIMELLSEIFLDRREGEKTPLYLCDCKWNVAVHMLSKYIQAPFTQPTIFLKIDFSWPYCKRAFIKQPFNSGHVRLMMFENAGCCLTWGQLIWGNLLDDKDLSLTSRTVLQLALAYAMHTLD